MSGRNKKVFVVDDDETVLKLWVRIFEEAGYGVRAFTAPHECIAAVAARSPDCIVSDLQMPGLDGAQLIRELRRLGHSVPVVIVTAAIPPSIQLNEAERAGAWRILPKPPVRADILDAVTAAIAGAQEPDRIGRHLLDYRQLLDHEEARLQALASMVDGARRAELEARIKELVDEREGLDETLGEYSARAPAPANALRSRS